MPMSNHADRRSVLTWTAGGALILGLTGRADARTHDVQTGRIDDAPESGSLKKRAFVDHVVMLAELNVKPDKLDAFLEYTTANLKLSRSYPGNLAFDILFNEAEPAKVVFYEVWKSPKAQQEYMAWRTQAGDLTKLLSFLASAPKFMALHSIAA